MADKPDFKKNNPNYKSINDPHPLSENPATPLGYENTYVEYDNENPGGKPVRQWQPHRAPNAVVPGKVPSKKK